MSDEWTKTPNGNFNIELDGLTQTETDLLVIGYVNSLNDATVELFNEQLNEHNVKDALYAAVLNEAIIDAVKAECDKLENDKED